MSAHTPGPWIVEAIPDARGLGRRVFTDRIEIKPKDSTALVACMFHKNFGIDGERDSANARLIAAAPELLALAQRCEKWLSEVEASEIKAGKRPDESQFLLDLRDAIAKAGA